MTADKINRTRRAILTFGTLGVLLARKSTASRAARPIDNSIRLKLDAIGREVLAETRAGRATGISLSVAQNGVILWESGFGLARREPLRRASAHTPFSLASITKTFTAAAVTRLVETGKLELDAPIDRYLQSPLPHSRFNSEAVTLRLLGGHAAGLPTLFEMYDQSHPQPTLSELIRDYGELAYPAGERYEYANLGYSLLGAAVSRFTGRTFAQSLNHLVIQPLGLRNTFFDTDTARMQAAAARYDQNNREIPFYTTATPPSGELYASAHDLNIFAVSMLNIKPEGGAPLLGRGSLHALFAPVFTGQSGAFTTFGWSGRDVAGERIIVKTGGQPGVAARLTLLPSRKLSIAVIANRDDNRDLVAKISSHLAAALVADWSNPSFRMDEDSGADAGANDYSGTWSGSIRNGDKSENVRILIKGAGASQLVIGTGIARAMREINTQSGTLIFNVEGGLDAPTAADGVMRQMEFKLVLRNGELMGRCLSDCSMPGLTSTVPHIVSLSRT